MKTGLRKGLGPALVVALTGVFMVPGGRAFADCLNPANAIEAENCQPGNPASDWDVSGAGDANLQGFATDISVNRGQTVSFKVTTTATAYRIDIYRLGYYQGNGARRVATIPNASTTKTTQPACVNQASTGLVDCGNWSVSASWAVPSTAVSGVYIARLVRESGGTGASHVVFVVRHDGATSDLLFQTSDTTWQAYNRYGGTSLYQGSGPGGGLSGAGRAYKVSYNRPFTTREYAPEDWVFNAEYPMVRWLERNGYDVSYTTGVDTDRRGAELAGHKVFLSVGHDEYWSKQQRLNLERARDGLYPGQTSPLHLAFFSGNEVFWKTRWEASIDGSGTSHRTLVCYKETHAGAKIDPSSEWTGTWRDPRFSPPSDGGQPENALTGTIFTVNGVRSDSFRVPAADGKMRFWRNTPNVSTLGAGQTWGSPTGTLGYEWDEDLDNGFRPAGLVRLSRTTLDVSTGVVQDYGSTYAPGTATHRLVFHKRSNGAVVFGAGTVQWPWGLDAEHDRGSAAPSVDMQQATANLFADMGVQPATLQPGLLPASASSDVVAPVSDITSPAGGATVPPGSPVTIQGTATDGIPGLVGGVEVSVDGGLSWHPAEGRESWSYAWTPATAGSYTILSRAVDDSGNLEAPGAGRTLVVGGGSDGSSSIWAGTGTPSTQNEYDGQELELGVKFRSSSAGNITRIRFFKASSDGGSHVVSLWSGSGTLLATATSSGETASGWQEVTLPSPVAITANTTYVASYHAQPGYYVASTSYFTQAVVNGPLTALADGTDGGNGVYRYGSSGFPTGTWNATNYWVDVVFAASGPDTLPPSVVSTTPSGGASGVVTGTNVTARFSEALAPGTVSGTTVQLRDGASQLVSATVTWDGATNAAILDPASGLAYATTYTATVKGGAGGVTDVAGNRLASDFTWSFTTEAPPPPPPTEGPGGPVLVIGASANPFSRYYAEILRAEGLNAFTVADISALSSSVLSSHDVAILGEMPLNSSQVAMLTTWVNGGGNLIAMRPDKQLAGLLGLADAASTLSDGYLQVATAAAPGLGIVGQTVQFHGTADRYTLAGASAVATLFSGPATATANPAVTLRPVGANGGEAVAFAFDLARSIVYTRQGNPAWAGQKRDGQAGPIRSDDLFYPDWVNLDKVAIPQADEQQRLLANLILHVNRDRKPLPRFWYFPRGEKAVVVMTSDNHGGQSVETRFQAEDAASDPGCSVDDWDCIRSSVYLYTSALPGDAVAKQWQDKGFEVALHVNTNCANWTPASLPGFYSDQIAGFFSSFPSLSPLRTNRTHCIAWSDWATQPKVALQNGIRLDTNYYYWPPGWVANRPGFFTGSGMPMRFADVDGTMIDVYQAATQMTDESGQGYPFTIDALLDKALGAEGYYGAFTANIHTDGSTESQAAAIVASAKARSVPVVSARQMLSWVDGRNNSSFEDLAWSGGTLTFGISVAAGANGLQAMVPTAASGSPLVTLRRGAVTVPFTRQTVKGVEYAVFVADPGTYAAAYTSDTTAPVISSVSASGGNGTATVQWATDEPATSVVRYGTSPGSLVQTVSDPLLLTAHGITLTGLTAGTTYYYQVTSVDAAGNSASSAVGSFATTADATPPTVSLVAPVGGERLYTGSPYLIRWTATDNVAVTSIDVAFSSDGGTSYAAVAGCTGLTGTAQSCAWATPGPATTQGRIRVTARDAAGQTGTAASGSNFTVVSGTPSLTLTAPTTAVSWAIGSTQAITFDHNLGTGATVAIDLSRDGGATWSSLSPGFVTTSATTGSFGWLVTGPATTTARARVTWAGNPAVTGTSAVNFTIADTTAPTVAVTAPATGSTVSGTVTVSATASDDVAVAGVQFLLDGALLGVEDTASPYSVAWNTATASAGSHTLTARARDAAGNQTTSAAVSVTVASVPTGLVAAYGFEEGSGTTTTDASGLGHTGTIAAGTWSTTGRFGRALSFNGTSSLVTINDAAALRLTSAMTLEAWVRPTASASWRTAVLKETSGGLAYGLYASDTSGRPGGFLSVGSDVDVTAPSAITLDAWTHLAATYDGATLRLFVNGTQVTSRAVTGSIVSSTQPLRIGGNQVWGEYFAGLIDEVRVYNRPLSAAEIQADMNAAVSAADTTAPVITSVSTSVGGGSTATVQWATDEPATSVVRYGTVPGSLAQTVSDSLLLTAHSIPLAGLTAGTTYYYEVTSVDAAGNSASSAVGSFATTAGGTPPTVSLVAPVGGERLYTGSPYVIRWTASHDIGVASIDVAFSSDGGTTYAAVAECTGLAGTTQSCTWAAPAPATAAGRIRVTARDAAGQTGTATSGANFTVVSGTPSVTLTAPDTAVTWAIGSTQSVTFNHNLGIGATVAIDLSRDGGATWSTVNAAFVTTSATTGVYTWVVPSPATTTARIRVGWTGNPAVNDVSGVNFTVNGTIGVTAPATGARWAIGTPRSITWNHTLGAGQLFNILLSTDGGTTFPTTIASSVAGDAASGSYTWVVPGPATTTARVRVTWAARAATLGTTGSFRMENPAVTVTAPNTNVAWGVGSTRNLTFSHNLGVGQAVNIALSRDGGLTFSPITAFTTTSATSGSFSWVVTGPATTQARIRVTWTTNPAVTDVSNVNFRIQ